jgi:hypothetical protein
MEVLGLEQDFRVTTAMMKTAKLFHIPIPARSRVCA